MIRFFSVDSLFVGSLAADAHSDRAIEFSQCVRQARHLDNRVLVYSQELNESVRAIALASTDITSRRVIEELQKLLVMKSRSKSLHDSDLLATISDLRFLQDPPQPTPHDLDQFDALTAVHFQAQWQARPEARAGLLRRFLVGSKCVTLIDRFIVPSPGDQVLNFDQRVKAVTTILDCWSGDKVGRKLRLAAPSSSRHAVPPVHGWHVLRDRCRENALNHGVEVECRVLVRPQFDDRHANHNRYLVSDLGVLTLPNGYQDLCLDMAGSQATYDRELNPAYRWVLNAQAAWKFDFSV